MSHCDNPSSPRHLVLLPGDTIWMYDATLARRTVIAPDLRIVRADSIGIGAQRAWALTRAVDGSVIASAHVSDRAHIGYPLHVLTASGAIARSFGAEKPTFLPNTPFTALMFSISPATGDTAVLAASESMQTLTTDCWLCEACPDPDQHQLVNPASGSGFSNDGPETCEESEGGLDDCVNHAPCDGGATVAQALALNNAVKRNDRTAIQQTIADLGANVELNVERGSLQLIGCDGGIRANIPLSATQVALLEASSIAVGD